MCGTGKEERAALLAGHCYLRSIGREAGAMENVEKDRGHVVRPAESDSIAPRLSLGRGTQSHTAAPLLSLLSGLAWGFVCRPSTPSSQSVVTRPGELAALFPPLPLGL